jgi:hypothetical protein
MNCLMFLQIRSILLRNRLTLGQPSKHCLSQPGGREVQRVGSLMAMNIPFVHEICSLWGHFGPHMLKKEPSNFLDDDVTMCDIF